MSFFRLIVFIISISTLSSCATEARFVRYLDYWVGWSWKEYIAIDENSARGRIIKKCKILTTGHKECADPVQGEQCIVYWKIDQNDIIVGYRYEGNFCKLEPDLL